MYWIRNKTQRLSPRSLARALLAFIFAVGGPICHAQPAWKPEKNVEIVVGAAAGGGTDITARVMQKIFQDRRLVDSSVVVNKPGGGQTIAWVYLNQHAGDGHYLQIINEPLITNRIMGVSPLNYTDFTPVALLFDEYVIFAVKPDSPIKSGRDLVERLRASPDAVTFGFGSSRGNNTHMAIGMAGKMAGTEVPKMRLVVFSSGGTATTALLGGHIDVLATTPAALRQQVISGQARGIALTSRQRLTGDFAEVPTWREQGVDALYSSWRLVFGPKGMTREQIAFWEEAFAKLATVEEWKGDLEKNVREGRHVVGAELRKFLDAQNAQLRAILAELGMAKQ